MKNQIHYAIVFVSDMKRAVEFYRDVLGLPLRFESPGWTEFSTDSTTLALHPAGDHPAGSCRLGFHVDDLDAFHKDMEAKGVRCLRPPSQQFGVRLAEYVDPDGLPFSVAQTATSTWDSR